jgi:hypothetical protein
VPGYGASGATRSQRRVRRLLLAVAVGATAACSPGLPDDVTRLPPVDPASLLADPGAGWEPSDVCGSFAAEMTAAATRCFERSGRTEFLITAATPVLPAVAPQMTLAMLPDSTPAPELEPSRVATREEGPVRLVTVATAGRRNQFVVALAGLRPLADTRAEAFTLARRLQERDGGPPMAGPAPDPAIRERLDAALLPPPPGGEDRTVTADNFFQLDDFDRGGQDRTVAGLLSSRNSRVRALPDGVLVILVWFPHEFYAARALARSAESRLPVTDIPELREARLMHLGYGPVQAEGVIFRKGDYFGIVATSPTLRAFAGPDSPAPAGDTRDRAVAAAHRQMDRLPPGDTDWYEFPTEAQSMLVAAGVMAGSALVVLVVPRWRARRRRRTGRPPPPTWTGAGSVEVLDVTDRARRLRRGGTLLTTVQVVALAAVVSGLLVVLGTLDGPGWAAGGLLAGGLALGLVATAASARRQRLPRTARRPGWRSRTAVGPMAAAAGVGTAVVQAAALALLCTSLAGLVHGPSLATLDRGKAWGVPPVAHDTTLAAVAVLLLAGGAWLLRWTRARSRAGAGPRFPGSVLFLRPFGDDHELTVPTVLSARRPFAEFFWPRSRDRFEEVIDWELNPLGPTRAVDDPDRPARTSLGLRRVRMAEDWPQRIEEEMHDAAVVVVGLGTSEGLGYELDRLAAHHLLDRTILVFPPVDAADLEERWRFTLGCLGSEAGCRADLAPVLPDALATVIGPGPDQLVVVAAERDEAAYRAALRAAAERTTSRWVEHETWRPSR